MSSRIQKNRSSSVSLKPLSRTSSETNLKKLPAWKKKSSFDNFSSLSTLDLEASMMDTFQSHSRPHFSTPSPTLPLGGGIGSIEREEENVTIDEFGGGRGGDGLGDNGSENMDFYYQKMIMEFPNDPLLLGNYARFLKEVRGDARKAEEYCERAILANASEGDTLSMYGDLVWNNHKDSSRAQHYFHQALQVAPDDCYVLASYAQFLLESEEDEDEEEEQIPATKYTYLNPSKAIAAAS
ncbi:hypothetical protein ACFE04_019318 [Oxalis oulophora]